MNRITRRYQALCVSLLLTVLGLAGGIDRPTGAQSAAMGNSSVMMGGLWAAYNNQAGILDVDGIKAGAYYHNRFFVDGLSDQGLVAVYGQGNRAFALDMSFFGRSDFARDRIGLAYAMRLSPKVDMGVQLNYHNTRIGGLDQQRSGLLTAELGIITHLTEKLDLGVHIFNPSQSKLSDFADERLGTVMRLGAGYAFNDKARLVSEISKDIEQPTIVRAGLEYQVVPVLVLRAGLSNEPTTSSFGAGLRFDQLDIDFAATYHHALGYSTQISLAYSFGGDEN